MKSYQPGSMAAEGDAKDKILGQLGCNVSGEIGQKQGRVAGSAICRATKSAGSCICTAARRTVDGEHILGMAGVARAPSFVGKRIGLPGTVIALIEAHRNQAFTLARTGCAGLQTLVPGSDRLRGYRGHA